MGGRFINRSTTARGTQHTPLLEEYVLQKYAHRRQSARSCLSPIVGPLDGHSPPAPQTSCHASRSRSLHLLLVPSQARVGAALLVQSAPPDLVMHHAAMPPLPFPHHAAHRQVVDEDQDKRELAGSRGTRINCSTWGGVQVVCPFQWCPPRWSRPPRASFLRLRVSYTHLQTVSLILPSILSPRTTTLPRQCSACRGSCRNP